jgi:biotin operon repressor
MVISRLRDKLKLSGLELLFNRDVGRYEFQTEYPAFTILSGRTDKKSSNRRDELLERIGMEPFVSTQTLCEEFKVSRQALHPFLSALQKEGKIRVVKRGPTSGYIICS